MTALGIHAERVVGDPQAVRWVIPPAIVPVGRVRRAPGRLGAMLGDGTLSDGLAEGGALWLRLRAPQSWAEHGPQVQAALREALSDPAGWVVDPAPAEVLTRVIGDLVAGSVGEFIRSHGGSVRTEQVDADTVAVILGGPCERCVAAESTLRTRLMEQLRRRCPDVTEVDRAANRLTVRLEQR